MRDISIIIPVFNDADVLSQLYSRLQLELLKISQNYEIIFIDDGSCDNSVLNLQKIQYSDHRIRIIKLAKNYGQSSAIAAGMEQSNGELIVIMDSDLSDRPEDINKLKTALHNNSVDMIIAQRSERKDSFVDRITSKIFFRISMILTSIKHPCNVGVFRIIKRSSYRKVQQLPGLSGTILSRFYEAGIPFKTIEITKDQRAAGCSGYTFKKKIHLALDRILPHMKHPVLRRERDPYFVVKEIIDIRETK